MLLSHSLYWYAIWFHQNKEKEKKDFITDVTYEFIEFAKNVLNASLSTL